MTNREWLFNKMQNMSDEELSEYIAQTIHKCEFCLIESEYECGQKIRCCDDEVANWLKEEHKEPIALSEAERIILENIDKEYKWIARDNVDHTLWLFVKKPIKNHGWWTNESKTTNGDNMRLFNHLFQFITWEDDEPYNIAELLKGE